MENLRESGRIRADPGNETGFGGSLGEAGGIWGNLGESVSVSSLRALRARNSDLGKSGEIWGNLGKPREIWGNLGKSGETWGNLVKSGEIWGNLGKYGEFWENWGNLGESWAGAGQELGTSFGTSLESKSEHSTRGVPQNGKSARSPIRSSAPQNRTPTPLPRPLPFE